MDRIISSWFNVIQNGLLQNTYKLAWAKAIIECCRDGEGTNTYSFDDISLKMFGYYWNQTIHHNFKQSLNPNKPPVFLSYVNDKISDYQEQKGYRPIDFVKVRDSISFNFEFMISK